MADTIHLKDGTVEILLKEDNFERLLYERLGGDAATYYANQIEELQEKADYTQGRLDTDLGDYESELDSNRDCFNELLDILKRIDGEVDKKRINKNEIRRLTDQMETMICEQI